VPGGPTFDDRPALCKCLCDLSVTAEDMLEAMLYIVEYKKKNGLSSEAAWLTPKPTPKPPPGWK
jgi:hypothetical protein